MIVTVKDIIDKFNFKKDTGIFDINSGGFESHSFHSNLRLGDIITMDMIVFNIMKWDIKNKKGWNFNNSKEKYLGQLPDINEDIMLYSWLNGKLKYTNIRRISDKVFEVTS